MNNILTYNEFINEDYRDVVACGSGGIHKDDSITQLANGGGKTIIDTIGHPTGDKKVLGTEVIKVEDPYFAQNQRNKEKKKKKNKLRDKIENILNDLDKKTIKISNEKY
jgi:hypothetical protein